MTRYLIGRIAQALVVLWATWTVTYVILYLLPGDALSIMLTASGVELDTLTPAEEQRYRAAYGLDQGPVAQYFSLLGDTLRGDFGQSPSRQGQPVLDLVLDRVPGTLALAALAVVLSIAFGVGLAWVAAIVRWRPARILLSRLPSVGFSIPVFWAGLLLIQVFAFQLGWFPSAGDEGIRSLILPAVTLSIPSAAVYAQVLLRNMNDVWREPHIVTAQAKGLTRGEVQRRHVFRNAALPVLTLIGLQVGNTVSGAVLVETVFTRNGVGRLAQESVLRQDIPVVLAVVTLSAAAFVVVNLVVDLLYPLLDPRIAHVRKVA
ncbi:ABC transporter permease [Microbacterium sp. gxy059]|uniref:ABC transporter permease n=1 Tax=Microbacterium sp. gxy059 TaxID=2957199 RepID=UPI003D96FE55